MLIKFILLVSVCMMACASENLSKPDAERMVQESEEAEKEKLFDSIFGNESTIDKESMFEYLHNHVGEPKITLQDGHVVSFIPKKEKRRTQCTLQ